MRELAELAQKLESDEVGVEEGLVLFERGLVLASYVRKRLAEIENRVHEVKRRYRDVFDEVPRAGGNGDE